MQKKKGLVSEAGLARLAQRLGLELLSDEQTSPSGRKTRTLVIAGSAIALDIVLDNNIVQSISLAFHESPPSVARHADAASQILLKDLQLLPNQSPLTKTLDDFALNFERLATLDKLSISPGLDCQEALAGIFISLERLYEWDLSKLREDPDMKAKSDQALALAAMCTMHGYPVMHARGRVGLALQYWKQLRMVPPSNDKLSVFADKHENIWSLVLGCAPIEGLNLPPVRVSEDWISKEVSNGGDASVDPKTLSLDWQEPDNIKLQVSEDNKDVGMEMLQLDLTTVRVPRVMFTVTFDPPVILPHNDWIRLYSYANIDPPPNMTDFGHMATFDTMVFPIKPGTKQDPSEARTITRRRKVRVFDESRNMSVRTHRNSLFIYKPIYSQEVTQMPFSHPRQLIEMLPLLRQYAFLSTLLENSFGGGTEDEDERPAKPFSDASKTKPPSDSVTTSDEIANFINPRTPAEQPKETASPPQPLTDANIDVILWVHPMPQLKVVFPSGDLTVNITLRILEGGTVDITNENVLDQNSGGGPKGKGKELTRRDLGRVLEHMEDLCKWAEWIRTRLT